MTEASKKRMEELFSKWWFIVGGSIHGIWKRRQWSSLKEFAKNVPRMGYQEGYQAGMQDLDAVKDHPVVKELVEALKISRDKHIGMAMCLKEHGTNLNIPFLIDDCMRDAERDELALTKWREFVGESNG